jgi:hypothetical protein
MSEQKDQNEAACGGSALTAELGALADQFECHALSRSIDDVEAAGRAMRSAKAEIERLRAAIRQTLDENGHLADGDVCTLILLKRAIEVPNAPGKPPAANELNEGENA